MREEVDYGEIIAKEQIDVDYSMSFNAFIDNLNEKFSDFVINVIKNLERREVYSLPKEKQPVFPKLFLPKILYSATLKEINAFLNREKIAIFTGNRAEFGLLFPLIVKLSEFLYIDLYVSGAHVMSPWYTINYIKDRLKNYPVNILPIHLPTSISYEELLVQIYSKSLKILRKYKSLYKFCIVLGDRIESYGFALASFYSQIPIIHIYGGDIANVPYFDTNVRHSISKISHIFLTSNKKSAAVLKQLGEEEWRIYNVGNFALSYISLGLVPSKDKLCKELGLKEDSLIIFVTFHPSHAKNAKDNFEDFKTLIKGCEEVCKNYKNAKIIITYPNNDPGHEEILNFLRQISNKSNLIIVRNTLGTETILGLFKYFNVIAIGNSSMLLSETPYFGVPAVNIGDRQTDRFRGKNVFDVSEVNLQKIVKVLKDILTNYESLKTKFLSDSSSRFFFGDENSVFKAVEVIKNMLTVERKRLINKKFIVRDC